MAIYENTVDISKLKHNPDVIKKKFKTVGDTIICKDDIYVMFPEKFIPKRLAIMGPTIKLVSLYAILDKNYNYATVIAPVYITLTPSNVNDVIVNGVMYKLLEFSKDSVYCGNRNLVQNDSFMYDLFTELYRLGNIPWYINYKMLSNIFLESKKYANSNIGNDPLAFEILSAIIARDVKDKKVQYRHIINSIDANKPISYVGIDDRLYAYDNTVAKIMGSYMEDGLTTAILDPEKETTLLSSLLRA